MSETLGRRPPWLRLACAAALLVALVQLAVPGKAEAARGLTTGLFASEYTSSQEAVRDRWFDATVQANASVVRVNITWRDIAGPQPPADPRNPADPAYSFAEVDRAVREAAERGLEVFFTINSAPAWAEGPDRPAITDPAVLGTGAWKPDPAALGDFATALATRYSGGFPDPLTGGALPGVRYYEAWNEPNLPQFLAPQYEGGKATGVIMYREILRSISSAVKAVDKGNLVIGPSLAPYGDPPAHAYRARPFDFLRGLFCLKNGKKPKPKKCSKKQITPLDIFGVHALNLYGGPADEASAGDAASGDLDELVRALRVAEKAKNLSPRGRRPLWVTEFWWATSGTVPGLQILDPATQARYVAQSLYLHWKAGAQVSTYFGLVDEQSAGLGLFSADGTPKPSFDAFRFPFVADPQGKGKLLVWGKSPAAGQLEIQREGPNGWETVTQLGVKGGVFTTTLKIQGPANLRAAIGSDASLPWSI